MRRSTVERIGVSRTASVGALAEVLESRRLLSANILTWHNDLARTGLNDSETQLTPADVNVASFGKLFSYPVDGQVYAQPLYVSNLAIPGKGTHNVVFVATERNSVYAFDADSAGHSGGLLWHVNLGTPATLPNPTIYPPGGRFGPNISPYMGITGTPVIDLGSDTMYVDAFTNDSGSIYNHRIHALDLTSGADKIAPVVVQATYPGDGVESDGTTVTFDPTRQLQRPALAFFEWDGLRLLRQLFRWRPLSRLGAGPRCQHTPAPKRVQLYSEPAFSSGRPSRGRGGLLAGRRWTILRRVQFVSDVGQRRL